MKKVLITGANSYVGTNVEEWLIKEPENFYVETLDMKDPNWRDFDFTRFDVVFHVAGIAHISSRKHDKNYYLYINRDLAVETANIAKKAGVNRFIFMSSMSIYNKKDIIITKSVIPKPNTIYGISKYEAELELIKLQDFSFEVSIIRPPMIYGKSCNGNYKYLSNFAKKIRYFPNITNKRSMIFIDNFSEFIKNIIISGQSMIYFPQNAEYVNTSNLVKKIAEFSGKNITLIRFFNPIIKIVSLMGMNKFRKVFGDCYYDMSLSQYDFNYQLFDFDDTILRTEKNG
ncbi:MAG: NAD-dependent epimerase/dehydratase family protein [Acholeplasma sp.]|nr:NAD-dependent epimerase/dehydratase family protein [Acholeplasma sp.]